MVDLIKQSMVLDFAYVYGADKWRSRSLYALLSNKNGNGASKDYASYYAGMLPDAEARVETVTAKFEEMLAKKGGNTSVDLDKEFNALKEAQALLAEVTDEKSAEKAARKISSTFGRLPAPITMNDHDIEQWSIEQNKVSAQMERLRSQPYFEASGLQEAWTNVTDPYSRKRAQRDKK